MKESPTEKQFMDLGILATPLLDRKQGDSHKEIKVVSCTLKELLFSNKQKLPGTAITGQLTIPEYQRPYVWGKKQVLKLVYDLHEYQKSSANMPLYYLGSLILHYEDGCLRIIDGQQRITTMLLLNALSSSRIASGLVYNSPLSIDNIKKNHNMLHHFYEDSLDYSIDDLPKLEDINVTLVITGCEDLAYTFFETQNTGGVRLSGSDIIKSHHLRGIDSRKKIAKKAKKWESYDNSLVEHIVGVLAKARFWNGNNWKNYPFSLQKATIKDTLIEEFTDRTIHEKEDISHYYTIKRKIGNKKIKSYESTYRKVRQPLYDGNNFMDYATQYFKLHHILFVKENHDKVPDEFYTFRHHLIHGTEGTVFLKELFEVVTVTYVSRFGFKRFYEACLWLYRLVFSLRVSTKRNVREDGVFRLVQQQKLIDIILDSFSVDQLITALRKFDYTVNTENCTEKTYKYKHMQRLMAYFGESVTIEKMIEKGNFDAYLIKQINQKSHEHK